MNIKHFPMDFGQTRAHAWAMSDELTDNGDGTYSIIDAEIAHSFGTGSEIIVIDIPGKLLFWDADTQLAYDWTGEGGGGDSNIVGSAIVGTAKAD